MNKKKSYFIKLLTFILLFIISFPTYALGKNPVYSLKSPEPQVYALFGQTLATGDLDGDGRFEILVSAEQQRVGNNHGQGKVYIFDDNKNYLFSITTPNQQVESFFGSSISAKDINGDGKWEILVGAKGENVENLIGVGRAYLFNGQGELLNIFISPNPKDYSSFGYSTLIDDLDNDGIPEIIIGAPGDNTSFTTGYPSGSVLTPKAHGRVYIFSGTEYSLLDVLEPIKKDKIINLGGSLTAGDIDGDGIKELIVGAIGMETGEFSSQGEVYIFKLDEKSSTKKWKIATTLTTPNPNPMSIFGYSLAAGDLNKDGVEEIAIGAAEELVGKNYGQGRVYIYDGVKKAFSFLFTTPDASTNTYFGSSIIMVNVDKDKGDDLIIGSAKKNSKLFNKQGFVFAFSGRVGSLLYSLTTGIPQENSYFGSSMAYLPMKDGKSLLLVGAPGEKDLEGRVYAYNPEYGMPLWGYAFIVFFLALMGIYTTVIIRRFGRAKLIYQHLMQKNKDKKTSIEKTTDDHSQNP